MCFVVVDVQDLVVEGVVSGVVVVVVIVACCCLL